MARPESLIDELGDHYAFLETHLPFSYLSEEALTRAVRALEISYHRAGEVLFEVGATIDRLFVIRKGAVDVWGSGGALVAREAEGDCFAYPALLTGGEARRKAVCVEDTLLFELPVAVFDELRASFKRFDQFFGVAHESRLRAVLAEEPEESGGMLVPPLREMVRREPVFIAASATITEAAAKMAEHHISCLLVGSTEDLGGILTDRDLRNRVLAKGLDGSTRVASVMTERPFTVDADARALEALIAMTQSKVHHLPVMEGARVLGMVSSTDLLRVQAAHPVYVLEELGQQTTLEGLVRTSKRLPDVVTRLVRADLPAPAVARVVTLFADAATRRLLELATEALGPAPGPYAWVALGSQARFELGLGSDQDNALVIGDGVEDPSGWFPKAAEQVVEGLAACGFPHCPGDVMATNPKWRKSAGEWRRGFESWIDEPDPQALVNLGVFFDMRAVAGDAELVAGLRQPVLARAADNQRFLACVARAALELVPPLGFFRQLVLEPGGKEGKTLDIKRRGVAPIVSLARLYALMGGIEEVETVARIREAPSHHALAAEDAASLLDAYAFIAQSRSRHHARQIADGVRPDNALPPSTLSSFERAHLKDAFRVVAARQSGVEHRFMTGRLG